MIGKLDDSKWLRKAAMDLPHQPEYPPLIWFPHAGGGPAALVRAARQAQSSGHAVADPDPDRSMPLFANLYGCVLPGREDRYSETPAETIDEIVDAVDETLGDEFPAPILIGHSMGALIAHSLARQRESRGSDVGSLTVMAMRSPDRFEPRRDPPDESDADFANRIDQQYSAIPPVIRHNANAMAMFIPVLRADMRLVDTYQPPSDSDEPASQLLCSVVAAGGTDDRVMIRGSMEGWRHSTVGSFRFHMLTGDHFFPLAHLSRVLQMSTSGV